MEKKIIYSKVYGIIGDYLRLDKEELNPDTHIVNDVGVDSLALVELGFKFSDAFSIALFEPNESNMVIKNLVNRIAEEIGKNGQ